MIGLPHRVFQLEAVDLNDDGRKDLVALLGGGFHHALDDPGTTQVAYALPGGGLSKMVELHTGSGVAGGNIVFADLNADGISDSFMSKNDQHYYAELRIRSLQNTYVSPLYLWSYPLLPSLALAEDFDGDRRADIVMSQLRPAGGGYEIMVGYYRQVNGELQPPVFTTLSYQPSLHRKAYATGDLNSDGCKDLVIAATYNGLFFLDGSQCTPYLPILPDETGYIRRATSP